MSTFPTDIPICDPHFHVWDNVSNPKNLNLGPIADGPLGVYLSSTYLAACSALPLYAAVHVETVVGQKEGGFVIDTLEETRFVLRDSAAFGPTRACGVVGFVHLGREDAVEVLAGHLRAAGERFVGVRMILNFSSEDPSLTWPQVDSDSYLSGANAHFGGNVKLLGRLGLVFDFHANWFQLKTAAAFFSGLSPQLPKIVIDHLGCPKLNSGKSEEDAARVAAWKEGLAALAAIPKVNIKISGLEYIHAGWMEKGSKARELIKGLVFWVLDTFGPSRCMVASNFPVDLAMGGKVCVRVFLYLLFSPLVGLLLHLSDGSTSHFLLLFTPSPFFLCVPSLTCAGHWGFVLELVRPLGRLPPRGCGPHGLAQAGFLHHCHGRVWPCEDANRPCGKGRERGRSFYRAVAAKAQRNIAW